jgi:hypothetical protein
MITNPTIAFCARMIVGALPAWIGCYLAYRSEMEKMLGRMSALQWR